VRCSKSDDVTCHYAASDSASYNPLSISVTLEPRRFIHHVTQRFAANKPRDIVQQHG
jgi:hypothetical protein